MAALGASILATELLSFWSEKGDDRPLSVCLPGGTCSTAVLLHHELKKLKKNSSHPLDIEIVVIPCVGDAAYARRQMMALSAEIGASVDDVPSILQPAPMDPNTRSKTNKYFSFGQPHKSILRVFKTMKDDHEVVLDLLYGAPAWTILLKHWNVTLGPDIE
jgi:1-aminocyclopropane-1-carboxylate deaminase/D-cysteine desulfhydrase-like pyridoxal-dependent ACC family enzyme